MTKYGVSEAVYDSRGIRVVPDFDRFYRSIRTARADAFKEVMGWKGRPKTLYVYDLSDRPKQVGMVYLTNINQNMVVVPGSRWVLYENLNVASKDHHMWYMNKDGTLGKRRF